MTLDELESSLPNGLHDAELIALQVHYADREAILNLNVDISDPDADVDRHEERHRLARVVFSGLEFVVIDPPGPNYDALGVSMVDAGMGQPRTAPCKLPPIPDDCFLCWVFVVNWNGFVRIGARSVALEWIEQP
jgi:hypothetical protein